MQNPHGLLGTLTEGLSEPHHLRLPAGVILPSPQAARGRPRAGLAVTEQWLLWGGKRPPQIWRGAPDTEPRWDDPRSLHSLSGQPLG